MTETTETIWTKALTCYYALPNCNCTDKLWQCQTCKEWYCDYHFHDTDLGHCVECVACEFARLLEEKED